MGRLPLLGPGSAADWRCDHRVRAQGWKYCTSWPSGVLKKADANALLAKLSVAYEKLQDRNPKTSANAVRAFANQVQALVRSRRLPPDQAPFLLVGARGILDGA